MQLLLKVLLPLSVWIFIEVLMFHHVLYLSSGLLFHEVTNENGFWFWTTVC